MNPCLKRMFEDDDCSREEAELKAAILGKSYDECKIEWSRQFKKEFIIANINVLKCYNCTCSLHQMIHFTFKLHYYSDLQKHLILKCDNVQCGDIYCDKRYNFAWTSFDLTVSFYASELDEKFMNAVICSLN